MDERTERQLAADETLHAAIIEVTQAYEWGDDWFVNDWIVVGHRVHVEDDDREDYFRLYNGAVQPVHVAIGLLQSGLAQLQAFHTGQPKGDDE